MDLKKKHHEDIIFKTKWTASSNFINFSTLEVEYEWETYILFYIYIYIYIDR